MINNQQPLASTKPPNTPKWVQILIGYYGLLQSLHLLVLIRAGIIMLLQARFPFPILPPPSDWEQQTLALMLGLGFTDIVAILLGLVFAGQMAFNRRLKRRLGVISLTMFITGAIVFAFGTIPSGAWAAHPLAYGGMAILFIPALILYAWLLRSNLKPKPRLMSS